MLKQGLQYQTKSKMLTTILHN